MKITVTQQHINDGEQCSSAYCPIALAINEKIPNARDIFVGIDNVFVRFEDWQSHNYCLPKAAVDFVRDFDCYRRSYVKPFTFNLE